MDYREKYQQKLGELNRLSEQFAEGYGDVWEAMQSAALLLPLDSENQAVDEAKELFQMLKIRFNLFEFQMNATFSYIDDEVNYFFESLSEEKEEVENDEKNELTFFDGFISLLELTNNLGILKSQVAFLLMNFDDEDNKIRSSQIRRKLSNLPYNSKADKEQVVEAVRQQRKKTADYYQMLLQIDKWIQDIDDFSQADYEQWDKESEVITESEVSE